MPLENAAILEELAVYIRLVWLFVCIITMLMILLCYLYLSMRRAQEREAQSFAFSHAALDILETERRRVSRELHDTVLPLVRDTAVSNSIRAICMELMPPDFASLSLNDCLADLFAQFSGRTGIECEYFMEENLDFTTFSPQNQLHLYRIVQESLTNIEKHASARKAALVARRITGVSPASPEYILICVSDDGTGLRNMSGFRNKNGLSMTGTAGSGLGMNNMRQRAAILGAKLNFISESGNGLMVRVEIPVIPPPPPWTVSVWGR